MNNKLFSHGLEILNNDGLWEIKKFLEENQRFVSIKSIDWYRLVNLFHVNVAMWEHNINIGLIFLHKQIKSEGTLFLQLPWWNLIIKIIFSKSQFYFLFLATPILTYIYNFPFTWLHMKYIFFQFFKLLSNMGFRNKIPVKYIKFRQWKF